MEAVLESVQVLVVFLILQVELLMMLLLLWRLQR
jgi:hypothetical protein